MLGVAILLTCVVLPFPAQTAASLEDVRLKVSVLDPINRYVADLEKQHFKIYEGKVQQSISYFASKSAPLSLAVILDTTELTLVDPELLRTALASLVKSGNPEDELTLITLAPQSARVESFSGSRPAVTITEQLLGQIIGLSRLDEALYLGLNHVRSQAGVKKAVAVIGNPAPQGVYLTLKPFQERDVQLYSIRGTLVAPSDSYVELTGGRTYTLSHPSELEYYLGLIHTELRHQYILGYLRSRTPGRDDQRVSVQLDPPKGLPKMTLRIWKTPAVPKQAGPN